MSLSTIPSWLNIQPSMFTQALESGARLGLAMSEQQQRAQEAALNRAARQSEMASQEAMRERAAEERRQEFEQSQQFNREKLAQQSAYEAQKEARLQQYELVRIGLEKAKEEIASRRQQTSDEMQAQRLNVMEKGLDAKLKVLDLQAAKLEGGKEPTLTKNLYGTDPAGRPIGHVTGPLSQMKSFLDEQSAPAETTPEASPEPSLWNRLGNYFSQPSAPGTNPMFPPTSMWPGAGTEAPPVGTASQKSAARYRYQAGKGLVPIGEESAPIDVESQVQPER